MLQSKALAQVSLKNNPGANPPSAHLLAVLSKDTPIQVWDVDNQSKNSTTPAWHAKNVPNDELSLAVPIYDTSMAQISKADPMGRLLATSTAYG